MPDLDLPYLVKRRILRLLLVSQQQDLLSEIPYARASQRHGQQSCSFKPCLHLVQIKDIRIFLFSLVLLMTQSCIVPLKGALSQQRAPLQTLDLSQQPALPRGHPLQNQGLRLMPRTGSSEMFAQHIILISISKCCFHASK